MALMLRLARWDVRSEVLVGPMAGGGTIPIEAAGLATGAAIRRPADLPFRHLPSFAGLPGDAPDLFPGTVAYILSLDVDEARIADRSATSAPGSPVVPTKTRS